jgi:hypothetical protein
MVVEVTGQRVGRQSDLGSYAAPSHRRQHLRITLSGDQRLEHRPTGHPEDVTDHRRQLDLSVLQQQLRAPLVLPVPPGSATVSSGSTSAAAGSAWGAAGWAGIPHSTILGQPHRQRNIGRHTAGLDGQVAPTSLEHRRPHALNRLLQRCVAATRRAGDVADRVEPGAHPSTIGIIAISSKAENAHSHFNDS